MFTRCPNCQSTFRVSAAILQMAQGEVRCGACGGVFNALHTLVDDWTGSDLMATGPAQPPPRAGAGEDTEPALFAQTLEFDVPENEWQHFFITPEEPAAAAADNVEPSLGEDFNEPDDEPDHEPDRLDSTTDVEPDSDEEPVPDDTPPTVDMPRLSLDEETADRDTWQAFLAEAELAAEDQAQDDEADEGPAFVVGEEQPRSAAPAVLIRSHSAAIPEDEEEDSAPFAVAAPAGETARERPGPGAQLPEPPALATPTEAEAEAESETEEVLGLAPPPAAAGPASRETILDWGPLPEFSAPAARPPERSGPWLAASLLAALALFAQAVHHFRDTLAADPAYGSAVRTAYGRAGVTLHPDWPLEAYEIRGAKAIVANSGPGALDIVAEIAISGAQPVGLPMVRVVLRDRWSNIVASGVFPATDYLAEAAPAAGIYPPGTLIPVQITLKDPGASAQGYELDVCMPSRSLGLRCKSARDPFRS